MANGTYTTTTPSLAREARSTRYTLARLLAINEPDGASTYDVLDLFNLNVDGMLYAPLTFTNAI